MLCLRANVLWLKSIAKSQVSIGHRTGNKNWRFENTVVLQVGCWTGDKGCNGRFLFLFSNVFIGIPIVKMRVAIPSRKNGLRDVTCYLFNCSCHRILAALWTVASDRISYVTVSSRKDVVLEKAWTSGQLENPLLVLFRCLIHKQS